DQIENAFGLQQVFAARPDGGVLGVRVKAVEVLGLKQCQPVGDIIDAHHFAVCLATLDQVARATIAPLQNKNPRSLRHCALTRVTQTVCGEKNKSSLNYRKRALGSQGRAMAAATSSATMTWHDCCRLVCLELAMANPKKKVPQNVAGKFFVDTTCINCDACRQLAPATFADSANYSVGYA